MKCVFPPDDKRLYSFYIVRDDSEFKRVVFAINASRGNDFRMSDTSWVAFLPEETSRVGLVFTLNEGNTPCHDVKERRHADVTVDEVAAEALCRAAIVAGREELYFGKGSVRTLFEEASEMGCLAVAEKKEANACKLCHPANPAPLSPGTTSPG